MRRTLKIIGRLFTCWYSLRVLEDSLHMGLLRLRGVHHSIAKDTKIYWGKAYLCPSLRTVPMTIVFRRSPRYPLEDLNLPIRRIYHLGSPLIALRSVNTYYELDV